MNAQGTSEVFWSSNVWGGGGVVTGILCVGYAKFMEMVEFSQEVIFDAPVTMNSDLLVKGDLTVEGDLIIEGAITEGDVHILGDLEVDGDTTLHKGLQVGNPLDEPHADEEVSFNNKKVTIKGSQKVLISGDSGDSHGLELSTKTYISADLKVKGSVTINTNSHNNDTTNEVVIDDGLITLATAELSQTAANYNVIAPLMTFTGYGRFYGKFEVRPPTSPLAFAITSIGEFIDAVESGFDLIMETTARRIVMGIRAQIPSIDQLIVSTGINVNTNPEGQQHVLTCAYNPIGSQSTRNGTEIDQTEGGIEMRFVTGGVSQNAITATTNEAGGAFVRVGPVPAQARTRQMSRHYRHTNSGRRLTPVGPLRLRGGMPEDPPEEPPTIFNFEVNGSSNFIGPCVITEDLTVDGNFLVDGAAEFNGNLLADGAAEFNGNFVVDGAAEFNGNLLVDGAAEFNGLFVVDGDADFNGLFVVDGAADFNGLLNVAGLCTCEGALAVVGGITVTDVITGSITINIEEEGPDIVFKRLDEKTARLRYKNPPEGESSNIFEVTTSGEFHVNASSLNVVNNEGTPAYIECDGDLSAHGMIRCQYYYKHHGHNHITIGADGNGGRTHVYMDGQTEWRGPDHSPIWTGVGENEGEPQMPLLPYELCCKQYVDDTHSSGTLQTAYNHGNGSITLANAKPVSIIQYGVVDPPVSDPSLMVFKDYLGALQMVIQIGGLQFPALGVPTTITYQELAYLSGVTSAIQTQLNNRLLLSGGALTGPLTTSSTICGASNTELGYSVGVTSSIQTQLNNRLLLAGGNLTGPLTTSSTICGASNTELGYSVGVTSAIQTQLNSKGSLSGSNAWTGSNTFNTTLPTSTLTPTTSTQLVTKTYVDTHPGVNLLTSNNIWTGTNFFANLNALNAGNYNQPCFIYLGGNIVTSNYNDILDSINIGGGISGSLQNASVTNDIQIGGNTYNTHSGTMTGPVIVTNNIGIGGNAYKQFNSNTSTVKTINNVQIGGSVDGSVTVAVHCENYLTFGFSTPGTNQQAVFTPSTNFGTLVAGVFLINNYNYLNPMIPIPYSIADYANCTSQSTTSGALGNSYRQDTGISAAGDWGVPNLEDIDAYYYVRPDFGLIVYAEGNYSGTVRVNFKNTTKNPVFIKPSTQNTGSSCRIFYRDNEQIQIS